VNAVRTPRLALLALLVPLACAQAPPLAGTWKGTQTFTRGTQTTTVETTYVLSASGATFSGLVFTRGDRREVVNGTVDGTHLAYGLRNPFVPESTPQPFTAELTADGLAVTAVRRPPPPGTPARAGRGPAPPLVLHRISDDTVYHLPPALAHAPLPPFRALPPNGLALTPPMGWNSWNKFHAAVNDAGVRAMADTIVSSGMRDAGYVYVNIDDTWEGTRDAQGNIQSNSKFPDMKALGDYIHSKGLKFGIYSSPGPKTCAGYEGSYLHEDQDARTWASWGVDYLKYDWCSASSVYGPEEMKQAYEKMALALRATGRPIVLSLCEYGWLDVGEWGAAAGGNLWRTTGDISDRYASMANIGFNQNGRESAAGPGHWNDPDMLEIGNGGMTDDEYRTHLSLWSLLAAPLLAGNDLSKMTPDIRAILTNRDVISVDQDKLGRQGTRVSQQGSLEVWKKPLAGGAAAVGLFNRGDQPASLTVTWSDLGLPARPRARDLWTQQDLPRAAGYTAQIPAHGVVLLRVR